MKANAKILLNEDEASFQEALTKFLRAFYYIKVVSTLKEARKVLLHSPEVYEIILLDKGLLDGSGLELLEDIRSQFIDTAIIILTGDCDFNTANDFVIKSENIVQDLLLRIPIAINSLKIQKKRKCFEASPDLRPSTSHLDLTHDHYRNYVSIAEREYLRITLQLCRGEVSGLTNKTGLSRSTNFRKMTSLGVEKRYWAHRNFIMNESNEHSDFNTHHIEVINEE